MNKGSILKVTIVKKAVEVLQLLYGKNKEAGK